MAQFTDPLSHVRVAAPCRADWERMRGNDRVRFCDQCSMNVYNLSNMAKKDAEALILNTEGRLCVRYYSRADGSILTDNCPTGLRALKSRLSGFSRAAVASVLSFFAGVGVLAGMETAQNSLDAAPEASPDLISPVPLTISEPEEETAAPERYPITGDIAVDSIRAKWANGRISVGRPELTTEWTPADEK
jgi:hypothetical protein